jgi:hypothetical protein
LEEIWETPYTIEKEEYDMWDSLGLLDETPTTPPTPITLSVMVATPGREEAEDLLEIHPAEDDMVKEDGWWEPRDKKGEDKEGTEVHTLSHTTSASDKEITYNTTWCKCTCQAQTTSSASKEFEVRNGDTLRPSLSPPQENTPGRLPIKARLGPKVKKVGGKIKGSNQGPRVAVPAPTRRQLRNRARIQLLRDRA